MKHKTLFILSAIVLLIAFLGGTLLYTKQKQTATEQATQQHQANLARMHSPSLGPVEAKVHIVEFFDPACGTCRDFYPFVKQLMEAHPGQVRLSLRYAPFHEGADFAVRILEAARKQGKFWETLERLYATQDYWTQQHRVVPDRVLEALEGIGLDSGRLMQDINAPEITAVIAQDMSDVDTFKVMKTPEFFVNGKPMPSFGHTQLQTLVEEAVAEHYQ